LGRGFIPRPIYFLGDKPVTTVNLRGVWEVVNKHYQFDLAEVWDSSGVIVGDWEQPVTKILLSTDLTHDLVEEALAKRCDLLITHHPLWLGRQKVRDYPYKLETTRRAASSNLAIMNAHTNADNANPGVSDAIAGLFGLIQTEPLIPVESDPRFGTGRIGFLPEPTSLQEFANTISTTKPELRVRYAGDPAMKVQRVAVVGGSGDSFMATATQAGADVYVTSDVRHHPLQEHLEAGGCAIIEINHAIAESLWLRDLAEHLKAFKVELAETNTVGWI
jgi:dinuclear metal center YbgI/SA1388 family protein